MKSVTQVIFYFALLIWPVNSFTKLWTFDLLNLTTTTTHPEIFDWGTEVVSLGRGRIGFNGFVDVKEDLGDDVLVSMTVKRSLRKDGPYSKLPFIIDKETISVALNRFYKPMIMPSAVKCCVNSPVFKGKFVPPLTKRHVEINSCVLSNDDWPSIMMEGFYWVQVTLKRDFEANVYILSYVENML